MLKRFGIHFILCVTWTLMAMFLVPFFWTVMNQTFWSAGIGHVLTERPVAAAHHRMMGAIREYENRVERIGSLERHLSDYPDSPERGSWQAELDRQRAERIGFFATWFTVFAACYIPVGLCIEVFRRWGPVYDMSVEPFQPY